MMNSEKLGKAIAVAVSALFLLDTARNVAFALREGGSEMLTGFVLSFLLLGALYVSFWRAKEWARYILAILLLVRCGFNLMALFSDSTGLKGSNTLELGFYIFWGALGLAIIVVPGVRQYLHRINSVPKEG